MNLKIVYFRLDDFKEKAAGCEILYDYTVSSRSAPLPESNVSLYLFSVTPAGDIIEYRGEKVITLLDVPEGHKITDSVRDVVQTFESFAVDVLKGRPGRYEW